MIPTWLQAHLETLGRADTDNVSRRARTGICRTCGRPVIRGLDDDKTALAATCDPHPLDPAGEALALLTGRPTHQLIWRGDHYEIDHRDRFRITGKPAGTPGTHIVAEHRCHERLQAIDMAPVSNQRAVSTEEDECPF